MRSDAIPVPASKAMLLFLFLSIAFSVDGFSLTLQSKIFSTFSTLSLGVVEQKENHWSIFSRCKISRSFLKASSDDIYDDFSNDDGIEEEGEEPPVVAESVIRIEDGGSDLTNRFKYKVNALMGAFDPGSGTPDDENQNGNILNAMLKFPVLYSFNVVGKTNGMDDVRDQFIDNVKRIVADGSGDGDRMKLKITPRGKNYTRITIDVTVDSATIVNSIYGELKNVKETVMAY